MQIKIIKKFEDNGIWHVTFKYWVSGECACKAIKKKAQFSFEPSEEDLLELL